MIRRWKCPNSVNVENHPETILFVEKGNKQPSPNKELLMEFKIPRAKRCEHCCRSYTKFECVEV
jgi:hypothetical protein